MHAHTCPHASHAIVVIATLRTKLVYVFLEIPRSSLHISSYLRYYCNSDDDLYAYHQSLQGSRRLPSGDSFTCTMCGFCCNRFHAGICHFLAFKEQAAYSLEEFSVWYHKVGRSLSKMRKKEKSIRSRTDTYGIFLMDVPWLDAVEGQHQDIWLPWTSPWPASYEQVSLLAYWATSRTPRRDPKRPC